MEGSDGNKTDNSSESSTKKSSAADTSKAESSAQQESSISEQQQKTEQAKKDIAVLMEYKKKIPQVSEQDITYKTSSISKNDVRGEVYYVDSVIRDINNDGRMELIVKYDCTFDDNSFGYRSCYLYDLVSVVNGEAVATVNVNNDVFTSDAFEAFTNQMGLLQPGMANVYYDGMPFVRYKSVAYFPAKVTTTLDYGAYGIDIRSDGKGAVYFPFATLADMYTDLFYHHAGFNGEKVVANLSVNEISLSEIDPDYYKPILAQTTRPADGVQLQGAVLRTGPFLRLSGPRQIQ